MITLSHSDLISLAGIVIGFIGVLGAFMGLYLARRETKYDQEKHRVELELMRRSVETQMYSLNDKLVATEKRWKDVNHLLLSSQSKQPDLAESVSKVQLTPFLSAAGVNREDIEGDDRLILVLTPFHPKHKKEFDVISQVCQQLGLVAMRGDEEFVSGDVFPHILRLIVRARLIIANIGGRNPNVFYELGIAQGLGKTTILISPTPEDVPFDIRAKRLVLFKSLNDLRMALKDEIARSFVKADTRTDY
jgi:hypothetical protein